MKGFRQQAQSSRKERIREMQTESQNMAMALRLNQMMVRQLMEQNKSIQGDLSNAINLINELQYKILAVQKVGNFDTVALNTVGEELRLKDFNEASDKENLEKGYVAGTTVNEDSIVIITSTTDTPEDKGIFRSKLPITQSGVPELFEAFNGREVGSKAIVALNGVDHTIELLSILQPPAKPAEDEQEQAPVEETTH